MKGRSLKIWLGMSLLGFATLGAASAYAQVADPPIGGVCIYSKNNVLGRSLAGLSAHEQLAQLQQSSDTDLAAQRDQLLADERALTGEKSRIPVANFDRRSASLQRKAEQLTVLSRIRDRQIDDTRAEAFGRIAATAEPLLTASVTDHHCAILLDRGAGYSVNPDMDLTNDVITRLNGVMPIISLQLAPPEGGILSQFPHRARRPKHGPGSKTTRPLKGSAKPLKKRCHKACVSRPTSVTTTHDKGK